MTFNDIYDRLDVTNSKRPINGNMMLEEIRAKRESIPRGSGIITDGRTGDVLAESYGVPGVDNSYGSVGFEGPPKPLDEVIDLSGIRREDAGRVFSLDDAEYIDPPDGKGDFRYLYAEMGGEPFVQRDYDDYEKVMKKVWDLDGPDFRGLDKGTLTELANDRLESMVEMVNQRYGKNEKSMEELKRVYKPKNMRDYEKLAGYMSRLIVQGPEGNVIKESMIEDISDDELAKLEDKMKEWNL